MVKRQDTVVNVDDDDEVRSATPTTMEAAAFVRRFAGVWLC